MAFTRRSEQFREIAAAIDRELRGRGVQVDASVVDAVLNERIHSVAAVMRVTDRTALKYCPDDLPYVLSDQIIEHLARDT